MSDIKEKKPRKGNMRLHLLLGLVILGIVIFIVMRLAHWNSNKIVISTDDDLPQDEMECLDYFVYPSEEQKVLRNDDGLEHILVIGNQYLTRSSDDSVTVMDLLQENVNAKFYNLVAERTKITAETWPNPAKELDMLNLYAVVSLITSDDRTLPDFYGVDDCFSHIERRDPYLALFNSIDLNTIDTVLIMYDLTDYYHCVPVIAGGSDNVRGLYGSLYSSVRLLQEQYPHLEILISSPVPSCYYSGDSLVLSSEIDPQYGNSSQYVNAEYNVALETFVSFIDNYYYVITEENITEYVDNMKLTPKGVEAIAKHVAEFLNR